MSIHHTPVTSDEGARLSPIRCEGSRAIEVAYLINQYPKPSHTFIRREIAALERRGVRVQRISVRGWGEQLVDAADQAEREKTRYLLRGGLGALLASGARVALSRPVRFLRVLGRVLRLGQKSDRPLPVHVIYLLEACRLLNWFEGTSVQHVHAHFGTNSALVALLVRELGGPPFSFTVHGPEEFDRADLLRLSEKLRAAKFVVAISSYGRSQMLRRLTMPDWDKVAVVRCGLELQQFTGDSVGEAPTLVCVARFSEQKGHALLLEALRAVRDRVPEVKLILVGDGELRPALETLVATYELGSHVVFAGWLDDAGVQAAVRSARALVLPSFAEGLPVVIMEAMALRRPVISTFVAGIPELVRDGETGWLVPAGDVGALADAMTDCLCASAARLTAMGEAAKRRVSQQHDIDQEAAKLLELFQHSAVGSFAREQTAAPGERDGGAPT